MSEPTTPEPGSARRWPVALVLGVLLVAGAMALRGYLQRAETRRAHLAAVEAQNLGAPAELERLDAGTAGRLESCDEPCATRGACTLRDGRCVAASAEACRESQLCGDDGMCSLVDERCEPASDADCAASEACAARGECSFDPTWKDCAVLGPEDCAASRRCREESLGCDFREVERDVHGRAQVNRDCHGATDATCAASRECASDGRCAALTTDGKVSCAATRPAHCRDSEACAVFGACTARNGRCFPGSEDDCRASQVCSRLLLCELHRGIDGLGLSCAPRQPGESADTADDLVARLEVGMAADAVQSFFGEPDIVGLVDGASSLGCELEHDGIRSFTRCPTSHYYRLVSGDLIRLDYSPRGVLREWGVGVPSPLGRAN